MEQKKEGGANHWLKDLHPSTNKDYSLRSK